MSPAEQRLAFDRANRSAAHRVFSTRLARIRADVEARGIGSRVAGTVAEEVYGAVDAGIDVARERKGLVAGTIGALVLWVFRNPLIAAALATFETIAGKANDKTEDQISDPSE
jgi:hypothetical protein